MHRIVFTLAALVGFALVALPAAAQDRDNLEAYYYSVDWTDLSETEKTHWGTLGWNEAAWSDTDPSTYPETEWLMWDEVTVAEQQALAALGYDARTWNESRPRAPFDDPETFWNGLDWADLYPAEQNLWGVLGWTQENWDGDGAAPASEEMNWSDLGEAEQFAATKLGYTEATWNAT